MSLIFALTVILCLAFAVRTAVLFYKLRTYRGRNRRIKDYIWSQKEGVRNVLIIRLNENTMKVYDIRHKSRVVRWLDDHVTHAPVKKRVDCIKQWIYSFGHNSSNG